MKILFPLFLIIGFISCNQGTTDDNVSSKLKVSDNKDILDSWAMCATSDSNQMIQMDVCQIITFIGNGSGYISQNSTVTENFVWTLEKDQMKIMYKTKDPNSTFPDTIYYAQFTKQKGTMDLLLKHNDNGYYLSKLIDQ